MFTATNRQRREMQEHAGAAEYVYASACSVGISEQQHTGVLVHLVQFTC